METNQKPQAPTDPLVQKRYRHQHGAQTDLLDVQMSLSSQNFK